MNGSTDTQRAMEALLQLSGFPKGRFVERMEKLIAKAPDPETACRVITDEFQATGALERKWRKVITQTWQFQHRTSAHSLALPLTSQDVIQTEALLDARRVLEALRQTPAKLVQQGDGYVIAPEELQRLTAIMPSLSNRNIPDTLEHEWACVQLRRLRVLLTTLRLVRVYRGQLQVVASRHKRFLDLPLPQQYYVLWHADVYHVPWGSFAAGWAPYVEVVQEYLPLLWDVSGGTRAGHAQSLTELTYALLDLYQSLWEQEGVADAHETFIGIYEEYALPAVVGQLLVRDILARYGLIEIQDDLPALIRAGTNSQFDSNDISVRWTEIGEVMLTIERSGKLPCGIEMIR